MSPDRSDRASTPAAAALADRLAFTAGSAIHNERLRRGWTLRQLASRARVSLARAQAVEAGARASLEMYARLAEALSFRMEIALIDSRRRNASFGREEDPVHSAMGELEAAHLRARGFDVAIDEPYQHYQFAGRADVIAWSLTACALLHIENRTRFPNLQESAGSYNAKRAYFAKILAERLGIRGGFRSETHVLVGLWSAEILHVVRLRKATFASLCPDPIDRFEAWWGGRSPADGRSSTFMLLDPFATGRERRYVDLDAAVATARPRMRGYTNAAARLGSGRV